MASGILSVRNDLKLAAGFTGVVIILIIVLEALTLGVHDDPQATDGGAPSGGGPAPPAPAFRDTGVLERTGQTQEGQASEEPLVLQYPAVRSIRAELNWTDDIGSNDEFRLTLLRGGSEAASAQGASGHLELETSAKAGEDLAGNYTLRIEAVSCPGAFPASPLDRDAGNSWELSVHASVLEASR